MNISHVVVTVAVYGVKTACLPNIYMSVLFLYVPRANSKCVQQQNNSLLWCVYVMSLVMLIVPRNKQKYFNMAQTEVGSACLQNVHTGKI